jgi:hypothetical protein
VTGRLDRFALIVKTILAPPSYLTYFAPVRQIRPQVARKLGERLVPRPIPAVAFRELGLFGQLGNQLWQIASTLGIADSRGAEARFNDDWGYRRQFSVPGLHFQDADGPELYARSLALHIPPPFRVAMQDLQLFRQIEPRIRSYFAPNPPTYAALEEKFSELLKVPNKTAMHVRRGDYLVHPENHPVATQAYYRAGIERLGETNIVVFSDDIDWCRRNLGWARPLAFVEANTDFEDLFLMTLCQHHILANSSFSWWGAFLSDDLHPIYPLRWYGPSLHGLGIDQSLMFTDDWIGIDA